MSVESGFAGRVEAIVRSIVVESRTESEVHSADGRPFRSIDLALTGLVDGCVVLRGPVPELAPDRYSWLYDVPSLCLPQEDLLVVDPDKPYPLPLGSGSGNTSQAMPARGRFEAADGAGMLLMCPADRADWNGRLFLIQHGSCAYMTMDACYAGDCERIAAPGTLVPRDPSGVTPGLGANLFTEVMIDRGYAVAWLRKDAVRPPGGFSKAILADGRVIRTTHVAHAGLAVALAAFARREVEAAMGGAPERTYYYGHSGGGITGRVVNYSGANVRFDGSAVIDGFLLDDPGNGLYVPVVIDEGTDVLLTTAEEREHFRPQIDITRQLYRPVSYREAKRLNTRVLREKGLGDAHRTYELRGVSHFDAGMAGAAGSIDFLDLGPFMAAMIDLLDRWVSHGEPPPSSREDVPGSEPAIALPEAACPLGSYSAPGGGPETRFTAYDGREGRDTVEDAWRRLGLLGPGEPFTISLYRARLTDAARRLADERLLPAGIVSWYERDAPSLLRRRVAMAGS
ncbi:MAG: hypothetical protein JO181_06780 [Solirubrobacterales bacterium]|nr:hypothetical protein [Solirubrobacterales bacterium]